MQQDLHVLSVSTHKQSFTRNTLSKLQWVCYDKHELRLPLLSELTQSRVMQQRKEGIG